MLVKADQPPVVAPAGALPGAQPGENFEEAVSMINEALPGDVRVFDMTRVTKAFNAKNHCSGRSYLYMLPLSAVPHRDGAGAAMAGLDKILAGYQGTHNFHNFTSKGRGKKVNCATDASAMRYITEMSCRAEPITVGGVCFLPVTVNGQSFLLNQIRHMIALAVLLYRAGAGLGVLDRAFSSKDPDIQFPMMPGEFLFLDKCHYRDYQKRVGHHESDMSFADGQVARAAFVRGVICDEMAHLETRGDLMAKWLEYVYGADAVCEGSTSYKAIFDAIAANGGQRGIAGAAHLPPSCPGCDPTTGAGFRKPSPGVQFQRMRQNFKLW